MSALAGESEEPNNDGGDAVIGGKDQLQLSKGIWAFLPRPLNDLHSTRAASVQWSHYRTCFPQEQELPVAGWSAALCFETCMPMYTCSHRCVGTTIYLASGRSSAGPDHIFQNLQCVYTYRILERGLRPISLSLSLQLYRWGHWGPEIETFPRSCSTSRGGPGSEPGRKVEACLPLAPTTAPAGIFSPSEHPCGQVRFTGKRAMLKGTKQSQWSPRHLQQVSW